MYIIRFERIFKTRSENSEKLGERLLNYDASLESRENTFTGLKIPQNCLFSSHLFFRHVGLEEQKAILKTSQTLWISRWKLVALTIILKTRMTWKHERGKFGRPKHFFFRWIPDAPSPIFLTGRGGCTQATGTRADVFLTSGNAEACDDLNWSIEASLSLSLYFSL